MSQFEKFKSLNFLKGDNNMSDKKQSLLLLASLTVKSFPGFSQQMQKWVELQFEKRHYLLSQSRN